MERPGLERLLQPYTEANFLAKHWPDKPLVVHGSPQRLSELTQLPELQTPSALLNVCRGVSVTAILPDRRDESHCVEVSPEVAAEMYKAGIGLSVGAAERFIPALKVWVEHLSLDLGLPKTTWARCIVYVSPAETGAPPHFDTNANFSLQLRGKKTWRIAPNNSVNYPTERHVIFDEPSAKLREQCHSALPTELPANTENIELQPGSLLFVPRGCWHTTTSQEETLSLNFTFSQQSWAILAAHALLKRLHRQELWRRTPNLRADSPADISQHLQEATQLLEALRADLNDMHPKDLLETARTCTRMFRIKSGALLSQEGGTWVAQLPDGTRVAIETPEVFQQAFAATAVWPNWFTAQEIIATLRVASFTEVDLFLLLSRLVDAGVLESRDV
ncbi:MAG: cupin-like domain-containing protein [Planctomycetales bacterium]|nr:cupin-like domain-containing protein [Planctomycetales bacterium]